MKNTTVGLKIGILTFHRCINYGSYWQTRCLVEALQKRGYHATVLDHWSRRVNFAEWKCALQPVLPTPVPTSDYPLYRQKINKFFCAFRALPLSDPFPLEIPSQMEEQDLVIVGSDEVWNLSHPWYGYYPIFYGDGIKAKRIVSYAASFGNYDVTWKPEQKWINKLQNFDRISVRDENSRTIIRNVLGFEPLIVLDPCLQFSVNSNNLKPRYSNPYLALYGHNFSESFICQVRRLADEKRLPLVSVGYRNDWADEQWITADPEEFASFMHYSEGVVTNFFHGCIFALINSKPFVCEGSSYRSNKIQDLLKQVKAEKHLVNENSPSALYQSCLFEPLDEEIFRKITELRQTSNNYLDQVIITLS